MFHLATVVCERIYTITPILHQLGLSSLKRTGDVHCQPVSPRVKWQGLANIVWDDPMNSRTPEIRGNAPDTFYQPDTDLWRSGLIGIGSIAIVTALLALLNLVAGEATDIFKLLISLLTALLPALLFFFDLQTRKRRKEPEMARLLMIVFIMGILISTAITRPVLIGVFDLNTWLSESTSRNRLLTQILISGMWHSFMVFAVVRFVVWNSHLFSRRTDGVLLSMTLIWGYTTASGLLNILEGERLSILSGNLRLLSEQASILVIAIIVGYFLGKNRFENSRFFFLPLGLAISALVGGLLLYATVELNSTALAVDSAGFSPWPGIVMGLLALIGGFAGVNGLLNYENNLVTARMERQSGR